MIGQSQPVVRNVRQEEVVLARLRIGHTRNTHLYILKREEKPYCFECDAPFIVCHFLLDCGDFSHRRNKYFHVDTIKQLFNDVPIDTVFLVLKEVNLFNKLLIHSFALFIFNLLSAYHFHLSRRRTFIVIFVVVRYGK